MAYEGPCISCDSHILEVPEIFDGLQEKYGDEAPKIIHDPERGAVLDIPGHNAFVNIGRFGIAVKDDGAIGPITARAVREAMLHPQDLLEAVADALGRLDALMLECNHDGALLSAGDYPSFLKARIAGDRGHLSNTQAAALLARIDRSRLRCVVAAHLSRKNNTSALAQAALAPVLSCAPADILIARQDEGLDWLTV